MSALEALFDRFTHRSEKMLAHPVMFILSIFFILAWAACGPFFSFNDSWQMIVNTGTTIVTFLMTVIILNSNTRSESALQLKLDELIRVTTASNSLIAVEQRSAQEIADEAQRIRDLIGASERQG